METPIIGFANTMYTLWTVSIEDRYFGDNRYAVECYKYQKNISKDIDKVKEQYPNVKIDLTLRGHSSFERVRVNENEQLNNDEFWYGRYKGIPIDESADDNYIIWYWSSKEDDENRKFAQQVLEDRNYHLVDNIWLSNSAYNEYLDRKEYANELINNFNSEGYIETRINRNPNEDGELFIGNKSLIIKFSEVKEMYYNGYEYYLPVINGKTKKVKNKNVRIYGTIEDNIINVSNIEIIK